MSSFYGDSCWECKKQITKVGGSVLLFCNCLTLICQDCARKQLLNGRDTYESCIRCPLCNVTTDMANLVMDVRKAKDQELKLLKSSFSNFQLKQPSWKRATARSFHKIISALSTNGFSDKNSLLEERNSKVVSLKVAQLELKRLQRNRKAEGHVDPLSLVFFKSNVLIEKVIMSIRGNSSFAVHCNCIVCDEPIVKGRTVLLTCNCRNTHLCLCCVYQILANQEKTFSEGIRCPTCKKASIVMGGVEHAKEVEQQLVTDGFKHFQIKAFKNKLNEVQELHNLYSLYASIGLRGTADPKTFYEEEVAHTAKATTPAFLKLEIARLELMRQHGLTSTDITKPHQFLGPMSCLRFFEHKFLDIFLEPLVRVQGGPQPAIPKNWRDEPDVIHVSVDAVTGVDANEVREINKELAERFLEEYEATKERGGHLSDDISSTGTVYDEDEDDEDDEEQEESDVSSGLDGEEEDESDTDSIRSVRVKGAAAVAAPRTSTVADENGVRKASATDDHPDRAHVSRNGRVQAYASSSSVPSERVSAPTRRIKPILPASLKKARTSSGEDNARHNELSSHSDSPSIRKRPILVVSDEEDSADDLPSPPTKRPVPPRSSAIKSGAATAAATTTMMTTPAMTEAQKDHREERRAVDILRDSAMLVNVSSQLQTNSFDISAATSSLKASSTGPLATPAPTPTPSLSAQPSLSFTGTSASSAAADGHRWTRFEPIHASTAVAGAQPLSPVTQQQPPSRRDDSRDRRTSTRRSPSGRCPGREGLSDRRPSSRYPTEDREDDDSTGGTTTRQKFHQGDQVEVFTPPDGTYEATVRACYDDHTYDLVTLEGRMKYAVKESLMHGINPMGVSSSTSTSDSSHRRPLKYQTPSLAATRPGWSVGDQVEVLNQGIWYLGTVEKVRGRGHYDIHYVDGLTESDVGEENIRNPRGNKSPTNSSPRQSQRDYFEDRRPSDLRRDHRERRDGDKEGGTGDYGMNGSRSRSSSSPSPPRRIRGERDSSDRRRHINDPSASSSTSVQQYLEREIRGQKQQQPGPVVSIYHTPLYDRDSYRRGFDYYSPPRSHSYDSSASTDGNNGKPKRGRSPSSRGRSSSPPRRSRQSERSYEPHYSTAVSSDTPSDHDALADSTADIAASSTPRDLRKPPTSIVKRREKGGIKEHVLTSGIFYSYPSHAEQREKLTSFAPIQLPEVKQKRNLRALCKLLDFSRMVEYVVVLQAPRESQCIPPTRFIEENNVRKYQFKVKVFFEQKVVDAYRAEFPELFVHSSGGEYPGRWYCESVVTTYSPQSTVGMLKRLMFIQLDFQGNIRDYVGSQHQSLNPKLTFAECNILPDSTLIIRPRHSRF